MKRPAILASVLLVAVTAFAFAPVCQSDFINYDDISFVIKNAHVRAGLNPRGMWWALTTMEWANWHPITWMSFQLDYDLYRGEAWGFHFTNLLLHTGNVLLVFVVFRHMTGATWRSALVAVLFAVHPLHVESVAWISERKDVLSTFFWVLTIWAYARYAERPSLVRYLAMTLTFVLGLMSKSMVVTLPCVLLLLDYWPLARLGEGWRVKRGWWSGRWWPRRCPPPSTIHPPPSTMWLLLEKAPLLVLSVASSVLTVQAQRLAGGYLRAVDPLVRAEYALTAYVRYIGKALWPVGLIPYYPYPHTAVPVWEAAAAALLLSGITVLVIKLGRRYAYLPTGWFWYLGTLAPVIGIVPILGSHAMADRYTYVPLIGLFILLAWGGGELARRWRLDWRGPALAAGVLVGLCALGARAQVGHWRDSQTLWRYTLSVDPENFLANHNLGVLMAQEEPSAEAIHLLSMAARADPKCDQPLYALAIAYRQQGRLDLAIRYYVAALKINSNNPEGYNLLGMALELKGDLGSATEAYEKALELKPSLADARANLAQALIRQGKLEEAREQFAALLRNNPESAGANHGLGLIMALAGKAREAVASYRRATQLQPKVAVYHRDLAHALTDIGEHDGAKAEYEVASQLTPGWLSATNLEAWGLATNPDAGARNGKLALFLAAELCEASGHQRPEFLDTLAAAYAEVGRFDEAEATAQKALTLIAGPDKAERAKAVESRRRLYKSHQPFRAGG